MASKPGKNRDCSKELERIRKAIEELRREIEDLENRVYYLEEVTGV